MFCYENDLTYPVHISDKKFEDCSMDLLLITDENKSHFIHIKNFNRFMCNNTKTKNKKHFCRYCLQCFGSEKVLREHKETCFKINDKQSAKLKSGSIKFENHFKQLAAPFKIYADIQSLIKKIKSNDRNKTPHILKNIKVIFLAVLLKKLYVLMTNLSNLLSFTEEKMQSIILLKQFLKNMIIVKK